MPRVFRLSTFLTLLLLCSATLLTQTSPTLLSPTNGADIRQFSVELRWSAITSVSTYRLQLSSIPFSSSALPSGGIGIDTIIAGTGITILFPTNLPQNTRFHWRVASVINGSAGAFSASSSFTFLAPTPAPPLSRDTLVSIAPASLHFANVPFGTSTEQTLTITNPVQARTAAMITILNNTGSREFSVIEGTGQFSLPPGQSRVVRVRFTPSEMFQSFRTAFTVLMNTPNTSREVTLSGETAPVTTASLVLPSFQQIPSLLPAGGIFLFSQGDALFLGTSNNGLFRSVNGGMSWTAVSSGLSTPFLTCFAVRERTVFLGTRSGVFRSTDNGATWSAVNMGLTNLLIEAIAADNNNVFVSAQNGLLFHSASNGDAWRAIGNLQMPVRSMAAANGLLYVNGNIINSSGAIATANRGTFIAPVVALENDVFVTGVINLGGAPAFFIPSLPIVRFRENAVFGNDTQMSIGGSQDISPALATFTATNGIVFLSAGSIRYSTNGGVSWRILSPPSSVLSSVAIVRDTLYAFSGTRLFAISVGLIRNIPIRYAPVVNVDTVRFSPVSFANNERETTAQFTISYPRAATAPLDLTFVNASIRLRRESETSVGISISSGVSSRDSVFRIEGASNFRLEPGENRVIQVRFRPTLTAGTFTQQLEIYQQDTTRLRGLGQLYHRVTLQGTSVGRWRRAASSITTFEPLALTTHGSTVLLATNGGGIMRSTDNSSTWQEANTGLPNRVVSAIFSRGSALIAATLSGIVQSTDNGNSWSRIAPTIATSSGPADIFRFVSWNRDVVAGTSRGIFRSQDNGVTWSQIPEITGNEEIRQIAAHKGALYFLSGSRLFRSNGQGRDRVSVGFTDTFPRQELEPISLASSDSALVVGTFGSQLALSLDNGTTWQTIRFGQTVRSVSYPEDPEFQSVRVEAFGNTILAMGFTNNGYAVRRSTDYGQTWSEFDTGLSQSGSLPIITLQGSSFLAVERENALSNLRGFGVWRTANNTLTAVAQQYMPFASSTVIEPNPVQSTAILRFTVPERCEVSIELYSLLGINHRTVMKAFREAGTYAVPFDVNNVPSGQYLCRIVIGKRTETVLVQCIR